MKLEFVQPIPELSTEALYAVTAALETLMDYLPENSLAIEEIEEVHSNAYMELLRREYNYSNPYKS